MNRPKKGQEATFAQTPDQKLNINIKTMMRCRPCHGPGETAEKKMRKRIKTTKLSA